MGLKRTPLTGTKRDARSTTKRPANMMPPAGTSKNSSGTPTGPLIPNQRG